MAFKFSENHFATMICDKAQGSIFVYLNRNLQSHSNCRQTHTQPLPSPTVTCRVANIFPRSNLTRNSNEIKCHQCGFSPFLLIVLGNGIRATDDQGLGAVKPLPFLSGGPGWYRRYLTQGLQFKHQSAIMFFIKEAYTNINRSTSAAVLLHVDSAIISACCKILFNFFSC